MLIDIAQSKAGLLPFERPREILFEFFAEQGTEGDAKTFLYHRPIRRQFQIGLFLRIQLRPLRQAASIRIPGFREVRPVDLHLIG